MCALCERKYCQPEHLSDGYLLCSEMHYAYRFDRLSLDYYPTQRTKRPLANAAANEVPVTTTVNT